MRLVEPLVFVAAVMVCIWIFPGRRTLPVVVLAVWVLTSWIVHGETSASLGLSIASAIRCLIRWRLIFLAVLVVIAVAGGPRFASMTTVRHAARYLIWCIVQQAVYQSMVFRPIRGVTGRTTPAAIVSGALFSLVHLPNPVLAPATFAWGVCASLLFSTCPSVIALGGLQFLLSAAGVLLIPAALHHGFRIGPGY